jgi:hypothetical protein
LATYWVKKFPQLGAASRTRIFHTLQLKKSVKKRRGGRKNGGAAEVRRGSTLISVLDV